MSFPIVFAVVWALVLTVGGGLLTSIGEWYRDLNKPSWQPPDWLVTAAAHSPGALYRAERAGADVVLLAPVFPTESHPQTRPLGTLRFSVWCRQSPIPVYALGGVSPVNLRRLKDSGTRGFAGISGFLDVA